MQDIQLQNKDIQLQNSSVTESFSFEVQAFRVDQKLDWVQLVPPKEFIIAVVFIQTCDQKFFSLLFTANVTAT